MAGRPASVMTPARVRIAQRLDAIHKRTTHKAIAARLGVRITTLRHALYRNRK